MDYFKESINAEDLEKLELASFPGRIYVIDTVGAEFNRAVNYLRSQKIIGFDTETRPCFSPDQPRYGVALLQLSGPEKAYLFRIKHTGMHRRLCNLLANEKVVKVGAAINDDIRGLQKYAEFTHTESVSPEDGWRKITLEATDFKSPAGVCESWEKVFGLTLSADKTIIVASMLWV